MESILQRTQINAQLLTNMNAMVRTTQYEAPLIRALGKYGFARILDYSEATRSMETTEFHG